MLNKERVQEWVKALRSGEYEQGQRALRQEDQFCCLGVACDLYDKATLSQGWKFESESNVYLSAYLGYTVYPPCRVEKWFGLDQGMMEGLIAMNDLDGASFGEIADWLEQQLEGNGNG